MNTKLILESRFTTHQKTHIILSIGAPFLFVIFILIKNMPLNLIGNLILLVFLIFYALLVCIAFTKRGLLKYNENLYRGVYFKGKLLIKKKIDLTNKVSVAILKFKRSQKMAWFSVAKPDLSSKFNNFDITLLNQKHTNKDHLLTLFNEEHAKKAIDFLEKNFSLKYEVYSPDFD